MFQFMLLLIILLVLQPAVSALQRWTTQEHLWQPIRSEGA
jgi:hypothetical protein